MDEQAPDVREQTAASAALGGFVFAWRKEPQATIEVYRHYGSQPTVQGWDFLELNWGRNPSCDADDSHSLPRELIDVFDYLERKKIVDVNHEKPPAEWLRICVEAGVPISREWVHHIQPRSAESAVACKAILDSSATLWRDAEGPADTATRASSSAAPVDMKQNTDGESPQAHAPGPMGHHETKLQKILARASKKFWDNYDPADPDTAPTNDQVVSWLVAEGVAERTAVVMATILRADGLPVGRRKK